MTVLAGHGAGIAGRAGRVERSGELELAWDDSPWVDVRDDGNVLALVDGVLHGVEGSAAGEVHRRYLAHGGAFAAGLMGDFTAVVFDRQAGRLLVARDPLGVRPWYVTTSGARHAGAGSLADLVALPWVDTDIDERSVVEYLAAVSRSVGPTLYRAVTTLAPGHTWLIAKGGSALSRPHHRWEIEPDLGVSWDDATERCREVLDRVVADRLGTPTTCELSGGLDSSSVVGTAVQLHADRLAAARLVFETPNADERRYSDAVVDHWSIDVVSQPPWIPSDDEATELTQRLARPLPDPQFIMFADLHRSLSGMGRHDGLTGLGGDDAFLTARVPDRVLSALRLAQPAEVLRIFRQQGAAAAWPGVVKPTLHRLAGRGDRLPAWVRSVAAERCGLVDLFRAKRPRMTGIAGIDQRIGNITTGYDAAILESRAVVTDLSGRRETHPFLDPRFILATYGLDPAWPTRSGHVRALEVAAFCDRLPAMVRDRNSKAEFSDVFWPQVLDEAVLDRVRRGPLVDNGWLDPSGFDQLVLAGHERRPNVAIPLARAVALHRWITQL